MSDKIFQKVAELIAARTQISTEKITLDSKLNELGVDSLSALSLVYDLEDEYNVEMPNEEVMQLRTVRQAVEILEKLGVE